MGLEQPRFRNEDEEESVPKSGDSNVIQGPWSRRESGTEAPAEKSDEANVIEGPWRKPEIRPATRPETDLPPRETPAEKSAALETARKELDALYESADTAPKKEESEKERIPYTEGFEKYKRCEACGGKGRRFFLFTCKVCKGLGSVVESSYTERGYYEVDRGIAPQENTEEK